MGTGVRLEFKIKCGGAAGWEWVHLVLRVVGQGSPYKPNQESCCTKGLHLVRQCCGMASAF